MSIPEDDLEEIPISDPAIVDTPPQRSEPMYYEGDDSYTVFETQADDLKPQENHQV